MNTRIEDWSVVNGNMSEIMRCRETTVFTGTEEAFLQGKVYNHALHPDGTEVVTTQLVELDLKARRARTQTREYDLGEVSNDYGHFLNYLDIQKMEAHP